MIDVAVLGHGVVGSGVAEILINNKEHIKERCSSELNLKYVLDIRKFDGLPYSDKFVSDFETILNDDSVKIVAEVIGGVGAAYEFTKKALLSGKSVVTSNKELVAKKGSELLKIAKENNVNYLFEASVGGGIPVIMPLVQCLAANKIKKVAGILNGTTNFIMTQMIKNDASFEDALKTAQMLGYAESDPTADVEGHDACRKICILSSLAFSKHTSPELIYTEGISKITKSDVSFADRFGYVIKLIGKSEMTDSGKIVSSVYPCLVSKSDPLSCVDGVNNAIKVNGDAVGDVMFYGPGAGKLPTASAVVSDIIDCALHSETRKDFFWDEIEEKEIESVSNLETRFFIRAKGTDEKTIEEIRSVFGVEPTKDDEYLAFITDCAKEKQLKEKLSSLTVAKVESIIHIL